MLLQAHFEVSHNYLEQNNADCYLLKWKKCPTYIVKLKKNHSKVQNIVTGMI